MWHWWRRPWRWGWRQQPRRGLGFGNYRRGLAPPSRPWKQLLDSAVDDAASTGLGRIADDYLSQTVDTSSAAGINPTTVRLLRTWLFGSPVAFPGVGDGLSNYALTSFAVQAGLGDGVHSSYRYAGPIWTCDESVMAAMRDNGVWARVLAEEHLPSDASPHRLRRTWVDHAVRAATCALSTLDLYYHRRDPEGEKRDWGCRVLARMRAADRKRGSDDEDDDEDDDESDASSSSDGGDAGGGDGGGLSCYEGINAADVWTLAATEALPTRGQRGGLASLPPALLRTLVRPGIRGGRDE